MSKRVAAGWRRPQISPVTTAMRFAMMGSGAVGGYFGGRLAEAGADVTFIARGPHLDAMRAHGLRLESIDGDASIQPVQATDDPASVAHVDTVLVAVKTWQLAAAIAGMRPMVGPQTSVVPLLNGVEASDLLAEAFGEGRVLNGLCRVISHLSAPGIITHVGAVPTIALGERDSHRSARVEAIASALESAGITVDVPDDIDVAVWTKLLFVVSMGGVGAVSNAPMGVVRTGNTRRQLESAMREIEAVARARAVALPENIVQTALSFVDTLPEEGSTSLQRDIAAGRPSELDAWTGAVVRLGREAGVETPVNDEIYAALLPKEQEARAKG